MFHQTPIRILLTLPAITLFAMGRTSGQPQQSVETSAAREKTRRVDYVRRGEESITKGDAAIKEKDFDTASAYFKNACDLLPDAPNSRELHNKALDKFCDASVRLAEQRITEGRYRDAENVVRIVLDERYSPSCKKAVLLLARLEQPDYYNKTIDPKFRGQVEQVKQLLVEAQGFFDSGRYPLAKKRCEQALGIDSFNMAARQLEERIDRAMSDYGLVAYNQTRSAALREVDMAWERPVRRFNVPMAMQSVEPKSDPGLTERIRRKLDRIIVPKIEFRDATIREAIDFLKRKSQELDIDSPAGEKGVNIVLKLDAGMAGNTAKPAAENLGGIPGLDAFPPAPAPVVAPQASGLNPADVRVTVSLANIPLVEALRYVTGLANLKYKVEPYAVSVIPMSEPSDVLLTKEWKIAPDLIPRTPGAGGNAAAGLGAPVLGAGNGAPDATKGGSGIADRESAKNWLIANGVTFNGQASAVYIIRNSRLIVRNTQDQLDLIDTIISSGGASQGPVQIQIEAKFVEISQTNLKELSFDWTLGQANVPGTYNTFFGGGTTGTGSALSTSDYPFSNSGTVTGSNSVTSGNRSGSSAITQNAIDTLISGITSSSRSSAVGALAGVFTDPQFQVVVRALNQKKGVDLLSAPRVTTKSGQRAVIEVIREFRYPTEFDPPQIPQTVGSTGSTGSTGGSSSSYPVTPTTPTSFETRNTGVTLEVEPVVGPDGYTIDLNLVPQVVEFEGFINYGSPIQTTSTNALGVTTTSVLTDNVINQPIFSTRKITTSVSVFDGSTVMLGGLMREDVQKVEDKVPILGDIPILGRLFRSSVDQHVKRNLIIFVTARLVNASGEVVRHDEDKEEEPETITPASFKPELELPRLEK